MLFDRESLSNSEIFVWSDDTFQKYALKSQICVFRIRHILKFPVM